MLAGMSGKRLAEAATAATRSSKGGRSERTKIPGDVDQKIEGLRLERDAGTALSRREAQS